jgi:hypothetical protein
MLHLKRLVGFLSELKKFLSEWSSKEAQIMSSAELLEKLGRKVVGINMLEIEQYLRSSKVGFILLSEARINCLITEVDRQENIWVL